MGPADVRSLEMGSWFHLPSNLPEASTNGLSQSALFGSGRDALRELLDAWSPRVRRLAVPTYYCHDVVDRVRSLVEVRYYECSPFVSAGTVSLDDGEAAIVVEFFGMKADVDVQGGHVLVDRTMSPWETHDYRACPAAVFGSLRKALPVPDGGFLQTRSDVPGAPNEIAPSKEHSQLVDEVLAAMRAKARYLQGAGSDKAMFLDVLSRVDVRIAASPSVSGVSSFTRSLLRKLDLDWFRDTRRRNLAELRRLRPQGWSGLTWTPASSHAVLLCETAEMRTWLRPALAAHGVYCPVLWPIPEHIDDVRAHDTSDRTLILHVDHRYGLADMAALAAALDVIVGRGRG